MAPKKLIVKPGEGLSVWMNGYGADFKISGEDTDGAFAIVEHPIDPGNLVVPHMHRNEDEFSYVLEGVIGVRVADEIFEAPAGSYVFKPRGVPHTFWNPGPQPARILEIISPPGFERFFAEASPYFGNEGEPDFEKLTEIADRYHTSAEWWDWVPELKQKYPNLRLPGE
jgi:mannose-6-phosphate isomerase-like protein (cupin superfamily)